MLARWPGRIRSHAAESERIRQGLADSGLTFLFIKGVTLNILAYGSLGLKQAADIDLLIEPDAYEEACAVLAGLGYGCSTPGPLPPDKLARWAGQVKDTVWSHPERRIDVDLHQRLNANPQLLASVTAASPSQQVKVTPGITLPTLARDDLISYLCVHGTFSGWNRLKWIADLNALLQKEDEAGLERLHSHAASLGADRPLGCGLLLCHSLFRLPLQPALKARLQNSLPVRQLAKVGLGALTIGGATEITDRKFGTAPIHASNLLLSRGAGYKIADIRQKLGRLTLQRSYRRSDAGEG